MPIVSWLLPPWSSPLFLSFFENVPQRERRGHGTSFLMKGGTSHTPIQSLKEAE